MQQSDTAKIFFTGSGAFVLIDYFEYLNQETIFAVSLFVGKLVLSGIVSTGINAAAKKVFGKKPEQ